MAVCLLLALTVPSARADRIILPASRLNRAGSLIAEYELDPPARGHAQLEASWTDTAGRLVQRIARAVQLDGTRRLPIRLDLSRAVVTGNTLQVTLQADGNAVPREASVAFAVPPAAGWADWQTLIYQDQTPAQLSTLRGMGVTGGKLFGDRDDAAQPPPVGPVVAPLLAAGLGWYVENIATDFYSAYHRWQPGMAVNAAFVAAQRAHAADPDSLAPFRRDPGLDDPAWRERIAARLGRTVRRFAPYRPLYYSLGDEPGIADLAANWDFDVSARSLAGMRRWLRGRYGSLAALNREWGTRFARWDAIMPRLTDAAVRQPGENFAAWADFKAWMDVSFARAVGAGATAVHATDRTALAGLEGGQIPGWGGYDYGLLAPRLDVWEVYDFDEDLDLARAMNPRLVTLVTQFGDGPDATWTLWRDLLRGVRGVILWDDGNTLAAPDGTPAAWGQAAAPLFRELREGLPALLFASRREPGAVAILDSPPSRRVAWLLARRAMRDARGAAGNWATRDAEAENADTPLRQATRAAADGVRAAGLQPRFVAASGLSHGVLRRQGIRVLILPQVLALSEADASMLRRFVAAGGTVLADQVPGAFDGHGRRLPRPLLARLFAAGGRARTLPLDRSEAIVAALRAAQVLPERRLLDAAGRPARGVAQWAYRDGATTLLALQSVAGPAESANGGAGERPLTLTFASPRVVTDLRRHAVLGRVRRVRLMLDGAAPTVLGLATASAGAPRLLAPARARAGETVTVELRLARSLAGSTDVVHMVVHGPEGAPRPAYGGNVTVRGGRARWRLPLVVNDAPGLWRITAYDLLAGRRDDASVKVDAPLSPRH